MGVHDEFSGSDRARLAGLDAVVAGATGAARRARPTSCCVVLDDVGFAQLGCYGSDIATPNIDRLAAAGRAARQLPHHRAVLADARVPAHRPQPPHATAWAASPTSRIGLPRLLRAHPARRTASSPRSSRAHGYATYAVGKWHLTPDDETHMARRPRARWPLGRGFERWYGFLGGETHQFVPDALPRQPLGPAAAHARPRATTSPRTWPTARSSTSATCAAVEPRQAVLPLLRHRRVPLAAPRAARVDRALPRPVRRRAGTRGASATFARQQSSSASCRPRHRAVAPPARGCRRGTTLEPDDQTVAARFMECFAGFLSHTDDADRPGARRSSSELGELDNTLVVLVSDNGASVRGRRARLDQRRRACGTATRPAARSCASASTRSAARPLHNNYPWGWTMAGNTPFRRWKREVHEGGVADPCIVHWPRGIAGARRDPAPVRARDRRAADDARARSASTPPAEIGGVAQTPDRGHELRVPSLRRRRRARARTPRSTSRCSAAAAIYHDGWKAVTFKPLGPMYDDGIDPTRRSTTTCGSCTTSPRTSPSATTSPPRSPSGSRELVELWWEEARALPGAARSTTASSPRSSTRRRPRSCSGSRYRYVPVRRAGARERRGQRAQPLAHDHRDVDVADGGVAPEGVLLAIGSVLGGWSFHLLDGRLRYVHNLYGKDARRDRVRPRRRRRARTRSGSATRRSTTKAATASCSSTARSSARARSRASRRSGTRSPAPA